MAFRLSVRLGLCAEGDVRRVIRHFDAVGLPSEPGLLNRRFSATRLLGHMRRDKKNRDGRLRLVLVRGIGQALTFDGVEEATMVEFLHEEGCH